MANSRWLLLGLLCVLALASVLTGCLSQAEKLTGSGQDTGAPNIILIVTDDVDVGAVRQMPQLHALLAEKGTTFENAFVTNAVCCPSRATILRGQYTHNHRVLRNAAPEGGFWKFHVQGHESSTVATWLQQSGYRTGFVGKYFNGYPQDPLHVPLGWDEWFGWAGNYQRAQIRMNDNGSLLDYALNRHHDTDLFAARAEKFIRRAAGGKSPFFLYVAPNASHRPIRPAPRHQDEFADARVPRPPSFNEEDVSDKPEWLRDKPRLDAEQEDYLEELYRGRLRELLAVEDMIGRLTERLQAMGELEETYILFTSDNGYHLGLHRMFLGKWTAYEEDIRVPLMVRGPGVPEGRSLDHMVLNNDLAPTLADLAGAEPPSFVDGRSLVPLLSGDQPPDEEEWRRAFLIESIADDPMGRPAFKAVRTEDHLYVEYETEERELYDLESDPYQLTNKYAKVDPKLLGRLDGQLAALRGCSGEACREAEELE